jgi:hypothetical protein
MSPTKEARAAAQRRFDWGKCVVDALEAGHGFTRKAAQELYDRHWLDAQEAFDLETNNELFAHRLNVIYETVNSLTYGQGS